MISPGGGFGGRRPLNLTFHWRAGLSLQGEKVYSPGKANENFFMKQTLVFHANCQGEMLADVLGRHAPFAERFHCRLFINYAREPVPEALLGHCHAFVYQHLGPEWGALASDRLRAQLPHGCRAVAIPNMFLRLHWPLHQGGSRPHELRDILLDDLLERGVQPAQLGMLAQRRSLLRHYDLPGIVEKSLAHERAKEVRSDIAYVALMQELSARERCFYTVNHPGEKLLEHVANALLERLELPPLPAGAMQVLDWYYRALELPINPAVAQELGLEFVDAQTRYTVYGARLTYGQFAEVYGRYRQESSNDFIEFMGRLGKEAV